MIYALELTHSSEPGKKFLLIAKKYVLQRRAPANPISQTCTCYIRLYADSTLQDYDDRRVVAVGVFFISPANFLRQLRTLHFNSPSLQKKLGSVRWNARCVATTLRICQLFQQSLSDAYFKWLNPIGRTNNLPQFIKRVKRVLTVAPTQYMFKAADGTELMLTRYTPTSTSPSGALKGPVLFIHGMNSPGTLWAHDTTTTSWVEFLVALGYDTWTFDWRCSPRLRPSHTAEYSLDDVAKYDHAAALEKLCELTAAQDVIVFAHCVGAGTLFQALLGGHVNPRRIRALVAHQLAMHCIAPRLSKMKAATGIAKMLKKLKIDVSMENSDKITDRLFASVS